MSGSPVSLSLQVALASTAVTFFLGILAAYGVRKLRRGSGFFDAVFTLPLVLPPTVVGFLLLVLLGNYGPFQGIYERFHFHIVFTWWANIIAAIVVSFPLMYRTAYGTFLQVNEEYLQVARTLGMSEKKIFWKILLPLSRQGLISGIILIFTRSLGEFGATMMISGNIPGKTQTISTAIYSAVQAGRKEQAFAWVGVVMALNLVSIISLHFITQRGK